MADATRLVPAFLPPFYCPTGVREHPHGDTADEAGVAWMLKWKVCPPDSPVLRAEVGRFIAMCFPDCQDERQLELSTCLNYLLFAFDDRARDPGWRTTAALVPQIGRLLAVLDAPEATVTDPYQRALADLLGRLAETNSPHNLSHLVDNLFRSYIYTLWLTSLSEQRALPSLGDYVTIRINDAGTPWFVAHYAICGRYEVPHAVRNTPRVRAIIQTLGVTAAIDNDILSFAREHANNERNIIHILAHEHRSTPAEAFVHAVELRNRFALLHQRLANAEEAEHGARTNRIIREIGWAIAGNLAWSRISARYATAGRIPGVDITQETTGIDTTPLDLPSTRWWWDTL